MHSDWRTVPFQDLCDITRGASPRPIHDYLGNEGIPWIKIADATAEPSRFISSTKEKIKLHGMSASVEVFPGDLILSNSATPGLPKFLRINACIHDGWMLLRNFRGLDKDFAYWLLLSERIKLVAQGNGSVFTNLKTDILKSHIVTVPPLWLQVQIAHTLNTLDDRITLLRETNATLEAIAQALFKSWFVDFDPVRAKAKGLEPEGMDAATAVLFPDSFEEFELGLVPSGWKMSTLGAICESNGGVIQTGPFGSQLHASDYVAEGVPVVMPKDISDRRVDATTAARILPEDADRLSRHQLRGGDIVFSRRGDVEKHALIGETEHGWLCGTGCLLVRPGTRRKVSGYLSRSLDLLQTKQWLTQHAVGATMPNLNTGILSTVPALLPADEVLAAFEQVASAFDEHISESNATAKTLTQLRDTLLPRLISGQMRLPEAEASIKNMLSEAV